MGALVDNFVAEVLREYVAKSYVEGQHPNQYVSGAGTATNAVTRARTKRSPVEEAKRKLEIATRVIAQLEAAGDQISPDVLQAWQNVAKKYRDQVVKLSV